MAFEKLRGKRCVKKKCLTRFGLLRRLLLLQLDPLILLRLDAGGSRDPLLVHRLEVFLQRRHGVLKGRRHGGLLGLLGALGLGGGRSASRGRLLRGRGGRRRRGRGRFSLDFWGSGARFRLTAIGGGRGGGPIPVID